MLNSRQLAQLIGPTLSVTNLSELINLSTWENKIPSVPFLNGLLLFVAGISVIRVHNYWVFSWIILVKLTSWLTLILGLFRMLFPTANQGREGLPACTLLNVLLLVGLFMTFKGYQPNKSNANKS